MGYRFALQKNTIVNIAQSIKERNNMKKKQPITKSRKPGKPVLTACFVESVVPVSFCYTCKEITLVGESEKGDKGYYCHVCGEMYEYNFTWIPNNYFAHLNHH